jgi:hypothetical protein
MVEKWSKKLECASSERDSAPARLRLPNNIGIVGFAFVGFEIPIIDASKMRDVAIHKGNIRAAAVDVRVDIVLLCACGSTAIVEQPHNLTLAAD